MNAQPLISIIIPYYNSHAYFVDLLKSIDEQTIKSIQIVVIDDRSSEESKKALAEIVSSFPQLAIVVITNAENQGVAVSRNIGFKSATGEYITFIDADDLLCGKYSLEYRIHQLEQHKEYSGVGGYDYRIDEKNAILLQIPDKKIPYFQEGVRNPLQLRAIYARNIVEAPTKSASALFFATGSCLFRKTDLIDFPFDPAYETEDDVEWLLRFLDTKKIKLEMIPFHCRRIHGEQYHLKTPSKITEKVKELAKNIVK